MKPHPDTSVPSPDNIKMASSSPEIKAKVRLQETEDMSPPKRRGRPPGSKNKVKPVATPKVTPRVTPKKKASLDVKAEVVVTAQSKFMLDSDSEDVAPAPVHTFGPLYKAEVIKMMYVSGETAEPSAETTGMVEEIVRQQVIEMVSTNLLNLDMLLIWLASHMYRERCSSWF